MRFCGRAILFIPEISSVSNESVYFLSTHEYALYLVCFLLFFDFQQAPSYYEEEKETHGNSNPLKGDKDKEKREKEMQQRD